MPSTEMDPRVAPYENATEGLHAVVSAKFSCSTLVNAFTNALMLYFLKNSRVRACYRARLNPLVLANVVPSLPIGEYAHTLNIKKGKQVKISNLEKKCSPQFSDFL